MNDYLLSIKKIVDTLTSVGFPISDSEHIQIVFDGLSHEYDSIVTSIISRTDLYSIPEIETLLMTIEERIVKHKVGNSDAFSIQPCKQIVHKINSQDNMGISMIEVVTIELQILAQIVADTKVEMAITEEAFKEVEEGTQKVVADTSQEINPNASYATNMGILL